MSQRDMWKMLHLLYIYGPRLSLGQLTNAGVDCIPDTIEPLVTSGVVDKNSAGELSLSNAIKKILEACILANKRTMSKDMRVDYPQAFVIMPFSESWSGRVYSEMIEPAVTGAGLVCVRGDTTIRVGDLTTNIWNEILLAGIVIADVSVPNVNVFYEIGLVHALGKDVFFLKNKDATLPADFGGAHFYEYDLADLNSGLGLLEKALNAWAMQSRAAAVKTLNHQ